MLPEEGGHSSRLTSAALAKSNGGTMDRGPFGATYEEAPETGATRGFSGSLWGNHDGGGNYPIEKTIY